MTDCAHPSQEIRAKRARSVATMYGRQCLTCGALASLWLKKETIQDPADVPWPSRDPARRGVGVEGEIPRGAFVSGVGREAHCGVPERAWDLPRLR